MILITNGEYEYAVCVGIEKLEAKLDALGSGKEKVICGEKAAKSQL